MLARRMASGLQAGSTVIELGAGTGTLTDEILAAGINGEDLYLVEQSESFAAILEQRFPEANVCCIDADAIIEKLPHLEGRVDCVVSGLPLLWFDRRKKLSILRAVFKMLRPGGFLQQFTYVGRPPLGGGLMRELGLTANLVGVAPLNFPPAFVFRIRQRSGNGR